jgi:anti-sigma factor RsiW
MDFIDDDLSEKVRSEFLAHAVICPACRKELKEIQFVQRTLAGLAPVSVSSEFDFRLKASLRLEETRLRSPMYRLKLFMKDNAASMVGVPAATVLLLGGMLLYGGPFQGSRTGTPMVEQKPAAQERVQTSALTGSPSEDIHYVLESIDLSEIGTAAAANVHSGKKLSGANSINLIRY